METGKMKKLTFIYILVVLIVTCFTVNTFAADFYVIPAQNKCSPCKGERSSGERWCDNGDGTVTDMTTCLVWLKYANRGGAKPWRSGETDCGLSNDPCYYDDARQLAGLLASGETISTSGEKVYLTDGSDVGDWRLPTLAELEGITTSAVDEYVRTASQRLFIGVQSNYYWTSTTYMLDSSLSFASCIHMDTGNGVPRAKTSPYWVWPVRDWK